MEWECVWLLGVPTRVPRTAKGDILAWTSIAELGNQSQLWDYQKCHSHLRTPQRKQRGINAQ